MAVNEILPDGNTDFSGGQDSYIDPTNIAPNQYHSGINISSEKHSITQRWGIIECPLDFSLTGTYRRATGLEVTFEEVYYSGKFQAFVPYSIGPDRYNIYVVSGFIFLINLSTYAVVVMNPTDSLNPNADRINTEQAAQYLVIFDFPNNGFILDGIQIRRADPSLNEIPTSVMGTYNQNRLCIANAGLDWTAGDPSGSTITPNAPITFDEIIIPSSPFVGDVYQIPTGNKNSESISAMGFLQVLDTSMGIGPLWVSIPSAIYSYRTDLPRISWQGGTSGFVFGSVILYNNGVVGQRAHTNVGGDLIFKSSDGQLRALTMARNQVARWSNAPISREVTQWLQLDDQSLGFVSVVAYFKNKIFATCKPYRTPCYSAEGYPQTDIANAGIVVLELDNLSTLSTQAVPVWSGLWTGVRFLDFAENNGVMYIAGKDGNRNKMYMFDPSKTYDFIDGKVRDIRSVIDTKGYEFTDGSVNKALHSLDLGLRELQETVDVSISYIPSTTKIPTHWKDLRFNTPVEQCGFPMFANGLVSRGIRDLNVGSVDETVCDPTSRDYMSVFKAVQLRLIITGRHWELEYIKLKARVLPQTELDPYCNEQPGVPVEAKCFDPWYIPPVNDCKKG
jgi:hypothetical protein